MNTLHKHLPGKNLPESGSRIHTKCHFSIRHPILVHACYWLMLTMLTNQVAAADPDSTNWIGLYENNNDWFNSSNWNPGIPGADTVITTVRNGETAVISVGNANAGSQLLIDQSSTVRLAGGSLTAGNERLGLSGTGNFTQSDGTNQNANLSIGYVVEGQGFTSSGTGTYDLSGGALNVSGSTRVGEGGTGTLNQTGGNHTAGLLTLGGRVEFPDHTASNPGFGTYTLNGGRLTVKDKTEVGLSGKGIFNQEGGTYTTLNLYVGHAGNFPSGNFSGSGDGTYNLSGGGSVLTAFNEYIGLGGLGKFTQLNGTHTVNNTLLIGSSAEEIVGNGTYALNGGSLNAANEIVGNGNASTGTFNQSGGTHSVSGTLTIGQFGGHGIYSLSGDGGGLTVSNEYIGLGGRGSFTQSGGTHTVNNRLTISNSSNYLLSRNGELNASNLINNGSFDQSEGAFSGTFHNNKQFIYSGGSFDGPLINNGSAVFNLPLQASFGADISGSGSLIKQGNGTLILTGDNNYSGGTTVSAGVLQGNTDSLQGDITNNASVVFDQANTGSYAGVMSGTGSLTKQSGGTLILSGRNTYEGGTMVSAGVLQGNTSSLQGDIINNASVVFDQANTGSYAGVMSGTGNLTKQSGGTLILTGDNNYSGGTNLNGGTLSVGSDSNLGDPAGALNFNGGILQVTGTGFTSTPRTINWGMAGGGFNISNVFTVNKSLGGQGSLTKQGNGKLILTGDNNYSGGTTVSAGVLQGNTSSLQGDITNNASVVFDQTNTGTYAGVMSGTGSLTKQSGGTLILSGRNTFEGGTTVSAGVLQGNTDSLKGDITNNASVVFDQANTGTYAGVLSGTGSLTKQSGGTLILSGRNTYEGDTTVLAGMLQGNTDSIKGDITNNASVVFDQTNTGTYSDVMSGTGSLTKQSGGTLILSGHNTYGGTTTVSAGVLQGNSNSLQGDILNNTTIVFDQTNTGTYAGAMSGTGSLTKQSGGTLILSGRNTYEGGTTVSAGVLQGNTDSLQGDITNNASIVFDQANNGNYAGLLSGTGSLTKKSGGILILTGDNSYSGGTNLNGGILSVGSDNNLGAPTSALNFNGGILQVSGTGFTSTPRLINWGTAGGGFNISNVFTVNKSLGGQGSLTKQGKGKLILTGDNNYSGGTTVSGGVLQGNANSLQGDILNNATVVFDQSNTGTYTGTMSGEGNFIKQNTGLLVFNSANNTYTGGTEVIAGNLQVGDASHPGASISGPVMIDPTGILSGHGTINGDVNNAGTISPGGSIGTLTVNGNVNFTSSSIFNVEISPQEASLLNVSGLASLGDANVSVLANNGTYSPHTYTILNAGSVSGGFNNVNIVNAADIPSLKMLTPSLQFFPNRVDLSLDVASDPTGPGTSITDKWFKTTLRTVGGRLSAPLGKSCPQNSLGFWARGVGMISSADASGDAARYDGGTAGVVVGVDGQFSEHLSLGMAGFTAHTDATTYQSSNNHSTADSGGVSLYGAYTHGAWQFKSVIGYGNDTYKAQRNIAVSSLSRQAQSKTYGNRVNNYTEASYSFKSGNLTLQPVAGLQLGWMRRDGFNETGPNGDGQNISVNGRTLYALDTLVGLRTRHELPINDNLKAQLELRTFYDHDFGTLQDSVAASLSNGQTRLLSTADRPTQRDAGIVGASVALLTTHSLNFYLDYNGEIRSGQQAHFIGAGVRYSW